MLHGKSEGKKPSLQALGWANRSPHRSAEVILFCVSLKEQLNLMNDAGHDFGDQKPDYTA
jgi:hypothetical protein